MSWWTRNAEIIYLIAGVSGFFVYCFFGLFGNQVPEIIIIAILGFVLAKLTAIERKLR